MIIKFVCEDSYEAEKLSSIFMRQKDESPYITDIVKIIENELIVKLKDNSHHSILFKDPDNALNLKKTFSDLSSMDKKIISVSRSENEVIMTLQ